MGASVTLVATGTTRVNLSVPHLMSSLLLAEKVRELESAHQGREFGEFWHEILACASGAVFAAVAALESYANELFIDHQFNFPELSPPVVEKLWELYEQKPVLDKFEFALLLKSAAPIEHGTNPYQDVTARNKIAKRAHPLQTGMVQCSRRARETFKVPSKSRRPISVLSRRRAAISSRMDELCDDTVGIA